MDITELMNLVGNELLDQLRPYTNATTNNIGPINPPTDASYPYLGYETARSRPNRGIGKGGSLAARQYNDDGMVTSVTYVKQFIFHIWVTVVTNNGDDALKFNIYDAIDDRFRQLTLNKSLHGDVDSITVHGRSNPQPSEGSIRSDRFHLEITYDRYRTYDDFEPMSSIDVDVDVIDDEGAFEAPELDTTFE